ncbi:MAG: DNA-processing protein DprA, partial [Phenylobacterium sp.]
MSRKLSDAQRRDWLRLARTENVGPVTFRQLIVRFGEPSLALAALPDLARRGGRMAGLAIPTEAEAAAELAAGEALGARVIAACEAEFPPALAALDPPPPLLWARGRIELLARSCVAVVGARVASAAGQRFARGLAAELGQAGQVIVSGLARGIDAAAHEGGLPTGTVAVLGGGVDDIYPPEHARLYAQIAETGCVVSESEPGRAAVARDFPRRNRIISGLSRAVVVVEAELRSGSLITARLAAEQGREVLAVPGSPLDPRAKGTNDLIRQGAALCEGAEDVLRALEDLRTLREPERDIYGGAEASPDPDDALRERVAALLSPTPVSRDEIARAVGAPAPLVLAALMELSL